MTKLRLKILCSNCRTESNNSCLMSSESFRELGLDVLKFKKVEAQENCIVVIINTKNTKKEIVDTIFNKYPDKIKQIIISKKFF